MRACLCEIAPHASAALLDIPITRSTANIASRRRSSKHSDLVDRKGKRNAALHSQEVLKQILFKYSILCLIAKFLLSQTIIQNLCVFT